MGKPNRPSPSASATLFPVGTKKKGNDGNTYIIKLDKNNRPSWKKDSGAKNSSDNQKAPKAKAAQQPKKAAVKKSDGKKNTTSMKSSKSTSKNVNAKPNPLKSGYPSHLMGRFGIKAPKMKPLTIMNKIGKHKVNYSDPSKKPKTVAAYTSKHVIPNVKFSDVIGKFKSSQWKECRGRARMVKDLGFDFITDHENEGNEIGEYRVIYVDIENPYTGNVKFRKKKPLKLVIIYNIGEPDCNTGHWGAVYNRDTEHSEEVCQISSVGDSETWIKITADGKKQFEKIDNLRFPRNIDFVDAYTIDNKATLEEIDSEEEDERNSEFNFDDNTPDCLGNTSLSCLPRCRDQLSKIVGQLSIIRQNTVLHAVGDWTQI